MNSKRIPPAARPLLAGSVGLLVALLLYRKPLSIPLLDSDSFSVIYTEAPLRTWRSLFHLASPYYFQVFGEGGYRPLTTLLYSVTLHLFGPRLLAFKLLKFFLHFGCAALVYSLGRVLKMSRRWALAAGCLYFVLLAAPVFLGAAFLPDILAAFFCLAAFRSYVSGRKLAAAFLYALALAAKETSILLPAVFAAYDWLLGSRRGAKQVLQDTGPLWAVLLGYLLWIRWGIQAESFYGPAAWRAHGPALDAAGRFAAACEQLFGWSATIPLALLWLTHPKGPPHSFWRWLLFSLSWGFLALYPVLNLYPFFPQFETYFHGSDLRYFAFGGAGLVLLVGNMGHLIEKRRWAKIAAYAWIVVLLGVRIQAAVQRDWRHDLLAGVREQLSRSPAAGEDFQATPLGRSLYSLPLIRNSDPNTYAAVLQAIAGSPARSSLPGILALFASEDAYKDPAKARRVMERIHCGNLAEFIAGVAAEPDFERGQQKLGQVEALAARAHLAADEGRAAEALGDIDGALRLLDAPWSVPTWRVELLADRAKLLASLGRYAEAQKACEVALAQAPLQWARKDELLGMSNRLQNGAQRAYDLAMENYLKGDSARAVQGFTAAAQASPDFTEAYLGRAAVKSGRGDWRGALADYDTALKAGRLTPALKAAVQSAREEALKNL